MGLRGEAILQFDWTVRQITDALQRMGLDQNTLLLITSDNGPVLDDGYADRAEELAGEHKPGGPFRGAKYSAFEAGSAVPFIAYWPEGIKRSMTSDALASLIDVPATLASLVGAKVPEGTAMDSENNLATWTGASTKPRDFAVSMAANRSLTLRTQNWKYISPSDGGPMITWGPKIETGYRATPQLYDIRQNRYEEKDVSAEFPKVLQRLQKLLGEVRSK